MNQTVPNTEIVTFPRGKFRSSFNTPFIVPVCENAIDGINKIRVKSSFLIKLIVSLISRNIFGVTKLNKLAKDL